MRVLDKEVRLGGGVVDGADGHCQRTLASDNSD